MTLPESAPGRAQRVEAARKGWIARLIDMSRRNQLLYYRPLATGTLELAAGKPDAAAGDPNAAAGEPNASAGEPNASAGEPNTSAGARHASPIETLFAGQPVALDRLVRPEERAIAYAKAREIRRRAQINQEERGLETLFLARGLATWHPRDEGRPPAAPVLLVPVAIDLQGRAGHGLTLRRVGDTQLNPVLIHALEAEFGCKLDPDLPVFAARADGEVARTGTETGARTGNRGDEPLEHPESKDPADSAADFERVRAWLGAQASRVEGFEIRDSLVLSNFSFQKMAMVRDLEQQAAVLAEHDLVAALAGHQGARDAVRAKCAQPEVADLDELKPDDEHLFLDADATQQRAIMAVLAGRTGVIQGPPGTGKSQTIANLIAAFAARGKRVLFVAEKRAALDAVRKRLDQAGLGHLVLDLHGADIRRRQLLEQFAHSLDQVGRIGPVDGTEAHRGFEDRRGLLNAHVRRLHTPQPLSGLSVFALQGSLLRLPAAAANSTRWRGPFLDALDAPAAERIRALLAEAAASASLFLRTDGSPWARSSLTTGDAAIAAVDRAATIASRYWPAYGRDLAALVREAGFRLPATLQEAGSMVDLVAAVGATLSNYDAALFDGRAPRLAAALSPAGDGLLPSLWAWLTAPGYRAALQEARTLRSAGKASPGRLHSEVAAAAAQHEAWRGFQEPLSGSGRVMQGTKAYSDPANGDPGNGAPGTAGVSPAASAIATSRTTLHVQLEALAADLGRTDFETMPLPELDVLLKALAADTHTPRRIPRPREIEAELSSLGLDCLVDHFKAMRLQPDLWVPAFDHAWYTSCLDRAFAADSQFAAFEGQGHNRTVADFCEFDALRLKIAAQRVMRQHAQNVVGVLNAHPDQADAVRGETRKRSRLASLRTLLERAPEVLTALRPCWMASPLSVSQLLPAGRQFFDVVVFDEASQVLPEDAIPALLRAGQAVVAGDTRQLPPTAFFAAGEDESSGGTGPDEPAAGFESILDQMAGFLAPWWLEWHYRSQDERLIAFSNTHIYGGRLVTFPGAGGVPPIQFVHVASSGGADQEDSVSAEVEQVVALVLDHARRRPSESLGVITMGIKHMRRIEQGLEHALEAHPDLESFFDPQRPDRFFVKNLERVQGDERDAIILSVGYGKGADGRLRYHFGPLLMQGGERRLNVAISRARKRTTLVASFTHHEMDPERTKAEGVRLLRLYLAFAASGGRDAGDGGAAASDQEGFEAAVREALAREDLDLIPRFGASRFRIDLVARHPDRPGRLVLAIECDGATYRSAPTARDRDRLRQRQLEALGWKFHRIWSTDWFLRPEVEVRRAVQAYQAAIAGADEADRLETAVPGLARPGLTDQLATAPGTKDGAVPGIEPGTLHQAGLGTEPGTPPGIPHQTVLGTAPETQQAPAGIPRPLRPPILRKEGIADYDDDELLAIVDWLMSDGLLRDNDTIVDQTIDELGFKRRTQKMRDRLEALVAAWRSPGA